MKPIRCLNVQIVEPPTEPWYNFGRCLNEMFSKNVFPCNILIVESASDVESAGPVPLNVGNNLMGVAWLENKIYVVYSDAKIIGVHSDQIPFRQYPNEELVIKFIEKPDDIASCSSNRCLFISDYSANRCIWKIQMPARDVTRCLVNGKPSKLSTTTSDQLLVIVRGEQAAFLEIYKASNCSLLQTVHFSEEIKLPVKALQLPSGNLVVLYCETRPGVPNRRHYAVSETTESGQIVRTCDVSKLDSRVIPTLSHMALDDQGRLYVADSDNGRVIIVDQDFENCQVAAFKTDQPYRLCYVQERRMLIVGQWSPASMTLLRFSSTNETRQETSWSHSRLTSCQNKGSRNWQTVHESMYYLLKELYGVQWPCYHVFNFVFDIIM